MLITFAVLAGHYAWASANVDPEEKKLAVKGLFYLKMKRGP